MSGYRIEGAKHIIQAGDVVNDVANLWAGAASSVDGAWLSIGALSKLGEDARMSYEAIRDDALATMHKSTNSMTDVRETLYQIAGVYSKAEIDAAAAAARVHGPRHRPEIDNPPP